MVLESIFFSPLIRIIYFVHFFFFIINLKVDSGLLKCNRNRDLNT